MRISDWSSDVCSSDLFEAALATSPQVAALWQARLAVEDASDPLALDVAGRWLAQMPESVPALEANMALLGMRGDGEGAEAMARRSEERREGEEGVSTCRSRWVPDHEKKNKIRNHTSHQNTYQLN